MAMHTGRLLTRRRISRGGLATLLSLSTLAACSELTGPKKEPRLVVRADRDSVSFATLGRTVDLTATVKRGERARHATLTWFSARESVASVTPDGRLTARGSGLTRVFVVSDSGGADSIDVRVSAVPARLRFVAPPASVPALREVGFAVAAADSAGYAVPVPALQWGVSDSSRASITATGTLRGLVAGAVRVTARAGALVADTGFIVAPLPRLRFSFDTVDLGAGQYTVIPPPGPGLSAELADFDDRASVTLTVLDSAIATAPATILLPRITADDRPFSVTAKAIGLTRVIASAPRWEPDTMFVRVGIASLELSIASGTRVPLGARGGPKREFTAGLRAPDGTPRPLAQPLWVRVASSDTTVLRLTADSLLVDNEVYRFDSLIAIAPGRASIIVSHPLYRPDTAEVTVETPDVYFVQRGLVTSVGHGNEQLRIDAVGLTFDTLRVSITQRNPGVLRLLTPFVDMMALLAAPYPVRVEGLALGVDTLIASAPGRRSDTLVVTVARPRFLPTLGAPTYGPVTGPLSRHRLEGLELIVQVVDSLAYASIGFRASSPVDLRITSSDPTVLRARPVSPSVATGTYSTIVPIDFLTTGTASLRIEDPAGVYPPIDLPPITVRQGHFEFHEETTAARAVELGTRTASTMIVRSDGGFTGPIRTRFRSTAPAVVRAEPDSANGLEARPMLIGGDAAGTAWVVAEAPGFATDSFPVNVTPTRVMLVGRFDTPALTPEVPLGRLRLFNERDLARNSSEPVTFRLRSLDTTRVQLIDSLIVIPANENISETIRIRTGLAGRAAIEVVDVREGGYRIPRITIGVAIGEAVAGVGAEQEPARPDRSDARAPTASRSP